MDKNQAVVTELKVDGEFLGRMLANAKVFSSGSVGYYANERVVINGEAYQAMVTIVKVGSKPRKQAAVVQVPA